MQKEDRALLVRHEDPLRPWQSTTILVLWTPFMHFLRGVWLFQFRINKIIFFIPCHISRKYVSSMIFTPKYGMYTLQHHSLTFVYQILYYINFCLTLPLLCRIPHCHFKIFSVYLVYSCINVTSNWCFTFFLSFTYREHFVRQYYLSDADCIC